MYTHNVYVYIFRPQQQRASTEKQGTQCRTQAYLLRLNHEEENTYIYLLGKGFGFVVLLLSAPMQAVPDPF